MNKGVHGDAEGRSRDELLRQFRDPPSEYGPIDCWWWEAGHLSKDKLRAQLEDMKSKGVAGTWFYPRWLRPRRDTDSVVLDRTIASELAWGPLESDPAYWTEAWWDFTAFAAEEHKRLGMVSWFSDWTAKGFFQDKVRMERAESPELMGRRLANHRTEASGPGLLAIEIPAGEEFLDAAAYRKTTDGLDCDSRVALAGPGADGRLTWEAP